MKESMVAVLFLLFFAPVKAQNVDSLWVLNNYTKIERSIPMRDGIKLFTSIYLPKDHSVDHPILLTRTPYSCQPYGEDKMQAWWHNYQMAYLKERYIMVIQDVRGRWMSEGVYENVRPFNAEKQGTEIDEASDAYDTIDWLIKNIGNNNGRVGVFGISYPGFYSTMAAASNHPALKAVSPQAPVTNWFVGDDFHHNGAFFCMDAYSFFSGMGLGFGVPHPHPTAKAPIAKEYPTHDNYQFYLEAGTLPSLAKLVGDSIAFWKDLYAHPNYDAWWKARDARLATKELHPAMLWVGGTFDAEDHWGTWNSYKAAETNNPGKEFNKIVMGPWFHSQWATKYGSRLGNVKFGSNTSIYYQQHIELPFFNYYLKGIGQLTEMAEATIFISGENAWRKFDQWPPSKKEDQTLYFQDHYGLDWNPATSKSGFSEYRSDPSKPVPYTEDVHFNRTRAYMTDDQRFAGRRPDVLSFRTNILKQDITLTGVVTADLLVSISTTDADFVVKLIDVFPDSLSYNKVDMYAPKDPVLSYPMGGYEMLVHGEVMRGKYRKSLENPEPFVPNKLDRVKFDIGDVAHTFKKGHRIMVQIQSSWFPLVDRNPQKFVNIYEANQSDFQKADIRIYHNASSPSRIVLPILK